MDQTVDQFHAQAGAVADADALKASFVADGYILHLFQSGWLPSDQNTAADFAAHECTFTGYSSQAIGGAGFLFSATGIDGGGNVVFASPTVFRQATDAVSPNQVGGYWIESTAGVVRRFATFPVPVPLIAALRFIEVTVFEQGNGAGYADISW